MATPPDRLSPLEHERRAKIFKALSDPTRLRIVELLACCDDMSGSEIAAEAGISYALLCHHMRTLREAGLTTQRKDGQTTHTTLNRELLACTLRSLLCETTL